MVAVLIAVAVDVLVGVAVAVGVAVSVAQIAGSAKTGAPGSVAIRSIRLWYNAQ